MSAPEWKIASSDENDDEVVLELDTVRRVRVFVEGVVAGHASPRWKGADLEGGKAQDRRLSEERAQVTKRYLDELIAQRGWAAEQVGVSIVGLHHGLEAIDTRMHGNEVTLEEAGGDRDANDPALRRPTRPGFTV